MPISDKEINTFCYNANQIKKIPSLLRLKKNSYQHVVIAVMKIGRVGIPRPVIAIICGLNPDASNVDDKNNHNVPKKICSVRISIIHIRIFD
jgi:hypothetical protein